METYDIELQMCCDLRKILEMLFEIEMKNQIEKHYEFSHFFKKKYQRQVTCVLD